MNYCSNGNKNKLNLVEIAEIKKKISIEEKLSEKKGIIPMNRDKDNVFLEHF